MNRGLKMTKNAAITVVAGSRPIVVYRTRDMGVVGLAGGALTPSSHTRRIFMQESTEVKILAGGPRAAVISILTLGLLGIFLRFASSNFNPQNEIPEIMFRIILLAPFAWLLLKPSKIAYQGVLAVFGVNLLISLIITIQAPTPIIIVPLIMQTVLGIYLFSSYAQAFSTKSKNTVKRIYAQAREAESKKQYLEAKNLYAQVVTEYPGTLEAELAAECLQHLPPTV